MLRAKTSFPYSYLKCAVTRPSWALGQPQMLFDLQVRLSLLLDRRSEKGGFRLLLDCARKRKQLTLRWHSVIAKVVSNCLTFSRLAGVIRTFDFTSL